MKEIKNIVISLFLYTDLVIRIKKDLSRSLKAKEVSIISVKEIWGKSKSEALQSLDWA